MSFKNRAGMSFEIVAEDDLARLIEQANAYRSLSGIPPVVCKVIQVDLIPTEEFESDSVSEEGGDLNYD